MVRWYSGLPGAAQARVSPALRTRLTQIRIYADAHPGIALSLATPALAPRPAKSPAPRVGAPPPPKRAPRAGRGAPHSFDSSAPPPPPDPDAPTPGFLTTAESADFDRTYDSGTARQDALADLRRKRAYWLFVLDRATARADEHAINFASDKFTTYARELHKAELLAQRQGLQTGDVLPRADHERILAAWAHHALRCLDAALPALSRRLLNLAFPEETRAILEPALLTAAYFEPFAHAAALATGQSLPAWWTEALAAAHAEYIENGREKLSSRVLELAKENAFADGAGI